jgi:hypothetical protein
MMAALLSSAATLRSESDIRQYSLEHALRPRAPDGLKHAARMDEDARLNRIDAASVDGGRWDDGGPRPERLPLGDKGVDASAAASPG